MINENDTFNNETTFKTALDIFNTSGIAASGSLKIEKDSIVYVEVESEFTTSYMIPFILPKNYSSKAVTNQDKDKKKENSASTSDSESKEIESQVNKLNILDAGSHAFHKRYTKVHLKAGEYYLIIYHGVNQYTKGVTDNIKTSYSNYGFFEYFTRMPKCADFKIRMSSYQLNNQHKSWPCLNTDFKLPPLLMSNIASTSSTDVFYSDNTLIPFECSTTKINISQNKRFLIKVKVEFGADSPLKKMFKVQLTEGKTSKKWGKNYFCCRK